MESNERDLPTPPPESPDARLSRTLVPMTVLLIGTSISLFAITYVDDFTLRRLGSLAQPLAILFLMWRLMVPGIELRRALLDRGFVGIGLLRAYKFFSLFGPEAARRIPTRDEAIGIPGVEGASDFLTVRNALTLALWHRDPKHFDLIAKGYRELTWAQHDAILATYGERAAKLAPRLWWWGLVDAKERVGKFDYLSSRLHHATGRRIDDALLAAAATGGEAPC